MEAECRFPILHTSLLGCDTFPLPLTGMEQFWLWDDSAEYPKRFRVALQFVGAIDWNAWNEALRIAVARHPMLVANLSASKPLQWIIPPDPVIKVCWGKGDFGTSPFRAEMNLKTEAGLRVWGGVVDETHPNAKPVAGQLKPEPMDIARYFFVVECHHAVSDGLGLRQCVAEWILIYDRLTAKGDTKGKLVTLDPSRLANRGLIKRLPPTADSRPPTLLESIKLSYLFLGLFPKTLASPIASKPSQTKSQSHIHRVCVLSPEETQRVLNAEGVGSATFNDLAVAAVLKLVHDWNQRLSIPKNSGKPLKAQRLRVMIPVDLRSIQDMRMPAANRLGFGFVVADSQTCSDRQTLIKRVYEQTKALRQFGLGWDFPEIFNSLSRIPMLAKWIPRIPLNGATAVVTNLGDLTRRYRRQLAAMEDLYPRCGDLKLEAVFCVPPLRPKTLMGIGLCRCGDTLAIGLILDGHRFSETDANELLKCYVQTLVASSK